MPIIDDIRENNKKLKGQSLKKKLQYFWEYYRVMTIIILAVLLILISIVKTAVTRKDTAFYAVFANSFDIPSEEQFETILELNEKKQQVVYDNSMVILTDPASYSEMSTTSSQKLVALVASATADVMLADPDLSTSYFDSTFFDNLELYFSKEELDSLGDKVIWYDLVDEETGVPTGESMPIAINVGDSIAITSVPCYVVKDVYFTVFSNAPHPDLVHSFYEHLFTYEPEEELPPQ